MTAGVPQQARPTGTTLRCPVVLQLGSPGKAVRLDVNARGDLLIQTLDPATGLWVTKFSVDNV